MLTLKAVTLTEYNAKCVISNHKLIYKFVGNRNHAWPNNKYLLVISSQKILNWMIRYKPSQSLRGIPCPVYYSTNSTGYRKPSTYFIISTETYIDENDLWTGILSAQHLQFAQRLVVGENFIIQINWYFSVIELSR